MFCNDYMELKDKNWRHEPESNRRTRICSPLPSHSATAPSGTSCEGGKGYHGFYSKSTPLSEKVPDICLVDSSGLIRQILL